MESPGRLTFGGLGVVPWAPDGQERILKKERGKGWAGGGRPPPAASVYAMVIELSVAPLPSVAMLTDATADPDQ
jgi:hypothetical protein